MAIHKELSEEQRLEILRTSEYREGPFGTEKSCPPCSVKAGKRIYYPVGAFGRREMPDGRTILQSWCRQCRKEDMAQKREQAQQTERIFAR